MTLFRYRWPSLKRELEIVCAAKTGHEDGPFQHELEKRAPKAVPADERLTGIEREELREVLKEAKAGER